jgi:hypothetical protein
VSGPRLSYVIVTDRFETIRRVVACLREQTARADLELVLVAPRGAGDDLRGAVPDEFAAVRVVEVEAIHPMGDARAAGVRGASAPLVFLGETHSFPQPAFAQALLAASAAGWDVLVPAFENGNPVNGISWSNFLMDYGSWNAGMPAGPTPAAPTWNVAYRRPVLEALDDRLGGMLTHGDDLAEVLRAGNVRIGAVPDAIIAHANVSRRRWWFEQRWLAGALVAESRRRRWSAGRRWLQVAASPLVPVVILRRLIPAVRFGAARRMPWTTLPALVAGACVRTVGEVMAGVRGAGPVAQDRMDEYELHKLEYTNLPY